MSRFNQSERWKGDSFFTVFSRFWGRESLVVFLLICLLTNSIDGAGDDSTESTGLLATLRESSQETLVQDAGVFDRLALYVPAGEAVTPFFQASSFDIEWRGQLSVSLRDDYRFRAHVEGSFSLEINGESVLSVDEGTGWSEVSPETRLEKGGNQVVARFRNVPGRDASLRVEWSSPDFLFEPINDSHWTFVTVDDLQRFLDLRAGRSLFIDLRCGACHVDESGKSLGASLLPGVDLSGIGSRRRSAWIYDWILDPKHVRPQSKMPKVFHGAKANDEVSAVLAFLIDGAGDRPDIALDGNGLNGKQVYEELNCSGCHYLGEKALNEEGRIWLGNVSRKFFPADLDSFLKRPNRHFPSIQMPQFNFSNREASDLAVFLLAESSSESGAPLQHNEELVALGSQLVVERGCVNCHSGLGGMKNPLKPNLGVKFRSLDAGCLSEALGSDASYPDFELNQEQRRLLRLVISNNQSSLVRRVPRAEAQRHQHRLKCAACHGQIDGVPGLDLAGGKLNAHWMNQLFSGELKTKPRPWLKARMPGFPVYGRELAVGLSHLHGYSGGDGSADEIDPELAVIGRQLVSPVEGFSCVSCHGVASLKPTQVFESEGINFSLSAERLRKDYFRRWLLNPLRIDPASKMPVYFDEEGNSPLYDVLDGDTNRQLEAIWQYFLKGTAMEPPPLE